MSCSCRAGRGASCWLAPWAGRKRGSGQPAAGGPSRRPAPATFADYEPRRASRPREIYRLLSTEDVRKDIVDEEVYLLWPETKTWYKAVVCKVGGRAGRGPPGAAAAAACRRCDAAMGRRPLARGGARSPQLVVKTGDCHVSYDETGEDEDVNIYELIANKEIAFSAPRPRRARACARACACACCPARCAHKRPLLAQPAR